MKHGFLPEAAVFFFLVSTAGAAPISTELKDIFDAIVCNFACFIEYLILAVSAAVIVLTGFRYMTSDDPEVRHSMRGYITYAFIGLLIVIIGLPAINMLIDSSQAGLSKKVLASFNCACTPHHQFEEFFQNISCRVICLIEYIAGFIAALIITIAGLRYMSAGDPHVRASMRRWVINALVGLLFLMIAIPALNYVTGDAISPLNCDCLTVGDYSLGGGGASSKYVSGQSCTGTDCPCKDNPSKLCCTGGKWTADAKKYDQLCQVVVIQSAGDVCSKCCNSVRGDTECHVDYTTEAGNAGTVRITGSKITYCSYTTAGGIDTFTLTSEYGPNPFKAKTGTAKCVACSDGTIPGECNKNGQRCKYSPAEQKWVGGKLVTTKADSYDLASDLHC